MTIIDPLLFLKSHTIFFYILTKLDLKCLKPTKPKSKQERTTMVNPPHVLLLPYPGQGHVLPMMELAQVLAKHGFKLTFVNTENTQEHMRNGSSKDASLGDRIRFVSISNGIGPGDSRKVPEDAFGSLYQVLPGKFEELIVEINKSEDEKITCLIADNNFGWALEIATKMGIKRAAFLPAAAALMVVALNIPKLIEDGLVDENGETLCH